MFQTRFTQDKLDRIKKMVKEIEDPAVSIAEKTTKLLENIDTVLVEVSFERRQSRLMETMDLVSELD